MTTSAADENRRAEDDEAERDLVLSDEDADEIRGGISDYDVADAGWDVKTNQKV